MANVHIIGTRGVPNRYGGFERLVEVLAPYLVTRGHRVTVLCEGESPTDSKRAAEDLWRGVRRRFVATTFRGAMRTLQYDWRSFQSVEPGSVVLIFGYGTAIFQLLLKLRRIRHCVNMDGVEWQRAKWGLGARTWLKFNEWIAARLSDELVADHPQIQQYLQQRLRVPSRMIAYGVELPDSTAPVPAHPLLDRLGEDSFFLLIARPEPENQIHLIAEAYRDSARLRQLVVIGNFQGNAYGRDLMQRYREIEFVGAVYKHAVLDELRRRSTLYLHGHSVGGTNPSLIEAMAAGALTVAHDNAFNRWVLGKGGLYFRGVSDLCALFDRVPTHQQREALVALARQACAERFLWGDVLTRYEGIVHDLDVAS